MNYRQSEILNILSQNRKATVNSLSKKFKVSEVTIRKDLDFLENKNLIKREHGYAVLNDNDNINLRLATNYEKKQKIANEASKLVNDNDVILIESGSCCSLFAENVAKTKNNVTIITNSVYIADLLRNFENIKIILLGGEFQKEAQVNVGQLTAQSLANFNIDKAFIGIDGFFDNTFSTNDFKRAQVVLDFNRQADKIIVLSDSSKFGRKSLVNHLNIKDIYSIITDDELNSEIRQKLKENKPFFS